MSLKIYILLWGLVIEIMKRIMGYTNIYFVGHNIYLKFMKMSILYINEPSRFLFLGSTTQQSGTRN